MCFHCATNIVCERLATRVTITSVSGMETIAMSASHGEIRTS